MLLYRPVGLKELELVYDTGMRSFPPRLYGQPFFYPVLNFQYAEQIARDWNTKDPASGYAGYVTRFEIEGDYGARFPVQTVGAAVHQELWVPAGELAEFNANLRGRIHVESAYFGPQYHGFVPEQAGAQLSGGEEQFVQLCALRDSACPFGDKAVYLNYPYWLQRDFGAYGVTEERKREVLQRLRERWDAAAPGVRLPTVCE